MFIIVKGLLNYLKFNLVPRSVRAMRRVDDKKKEKKKKRKKKW